MWSGWKAVTLLLNKVKSNLEHIRPITNGFVFELMIQYRNRSMGYDVPCKMLALIDCWH